MPAFLHCYFPSATGLYAAAPKKSLNLIDVNVSNAKVNGAIVKQSWKSNAQNFTAAPNTDQK